MQYRQSGHGIYELRYHLSWVTKYRRRILNPGVTEYLRRIFPKILKNMPGVEIETIGFDRDHLHMVLIIPPKYAISAVVAELKSRSSSMLRSRFPWLGRVYWKENIVWSPGFFISSVGMDAKTTKSYVEWQGRQDSGQAKLDL